MKTKLLWAASGVLATGLTTLLSYVFGARGETLGIIAFVTLLVSYATALTAASIAMHLKKKKGTAE